MCVCVSEGDRVESGDHGIENKKKNPDTLKHQFT